MCVTAGICEELLFRGFLTWYLAHHVGLPVAAAAQVVIFGVAHLYQGFGGIVKTGFAGAFFATAAGFLRGQVVQPGAGVAVDHPEWRRLVLQIDQDPGQYDVLDDVGEIPGVEGVAIIHGSGLSRLRGRRGGRVW